jgi:hypothetical protein
LVKTEYFEMSVRQREDWVKTNLNYAYGVGDTSFGRLPNINVGAAPTHGAGMAEDRHLPPPGLCKISKLKGNMAIVNTYGS